MKNILKTIFGRVMFTVLCLLVQLVWLTGLVWKLNQYYVWFSTVLEIIALIVVLRINAKSDFSAARLVWTIVILALPIFGISLYLMFGRGGLTNSTRRKYARVNEIYAQALPENEGVRQLLKDQNIYVHNQEYYIQSASGYPVYQNTAVTYFSQTEPALEAMLEDLKQAREFIFLEYFAVEDTQSFHRIEEVLLQKVKEGVEVRLIYDDFGSIGYVKPEFMHRMNQNGIKCRIFNPLVPFLYIFMNHRDHRKITVIDNHISYSGGFNLADEYFNITHPYGHWKDTGLRLEGDAVLSHTIMFLEMWNCIKHTDTSYEQYLHRAVFPGSGPQDGFVQPYSDTPLDNVPLGENVYMNILKSAARYVYISTPYLIIDNEMERELCLAAERGVDVRIITPAIPDKKMVFLLTQSYYTSLIRSGVRIYQYTPGFIHAKGYVSDDQVAVVGTINMDYRSLYLHFECATYLYGCDAVMDVKKDFMETFPVCDEIGLDYCEKRSVFVRCFQCVLRLFSPLL